MGYLRFLAAFAVVAHHFWGLEGNATVYCFYVLTGFIIAFLCSEVYVGPGSAKRLLASQFLRIYPTYWACLLVSSLLILALGDDIRHVHDGMHFPSDFDGWIRQITTFGLMQWPYYSYPTRILPSGWSLNIILVHYVVMTLLVGSSYRRSLWFFAATVLVTIGCVSQGITLRHLYFSFYGPSMAFAAGAVSYHLSKRLPADFALSQKNIVIGLALLNLLFYLPGLCGFWVDEYPIYRYPVFLFAAALIALLFKTESTHRPSQINTIAGELSYPVFLLHWPLGGLVSVVQGMQPGAHNAELCLVTMVLSVVVGFAIIVWVERPLKRFRTQLRSA